MTDMNLKETGQEVLGEEEVNSIEVHSKNMSLDAVGTKSNSTKSKSYTDKEKAQSSTSAVSVSGPSKKRKKSIYWEHFEQVDNNGYHNCKYCKKRIRAVVKNGTSGMKNHLERCAEYPPTKDKKKRLVAFQSTTSLKDGTIRTDNNTELWHFCHESARRGLARMIIVDEFSFSIVEREGFRDFCKLLNPEFVVPSRRTVTRDCYALFIEERRKLKSSLSNLSCRVCLTTDTWTSGQNLSYMCLTVHFIDDEWKLHKRILNFCPIAGHSGELIGKAVEKCLIEWEIKKVMTITVDNASSNDLAVKYLRGRLNHWGGSVLDGQYLHMRCATHILNLIVKDGLKDLDASIAKIRAAVRYVRSSPARLQKFVCCVEEEKIDSKGLVCLDVDTRWNSTYFMLA
ncbi:unnamed protein product [Cuscuta europaea]|uniref:BED-type domain-containing protein n=1 Tax=Cuscuta europaea TaxID=41803 RepID=A0A9P0ZHC2_CUSEU|nr:unnamed protein product [Cuscuta europaea]